MPITVTATLSEAPTNASLDAELHSLSSMPPVVSLDDVNDLTSIPLHTLIFIGETSAMNIGPVSSRSSDSSIDNGPGPVYAIIGVVIAIIVLGTVIALVAIVLFMKVR